jgi:hypothetical protein
MLLLIVLALVAGVVADESSNDSNATTGSEATEVATTGAIPTAGRPGSLGSTWYCAAGTATGDSNGEAEQTLHVANASGATVRGRLTAYPSEGAQVTSEIEVAPLSRRDVRVSDIVRAPYAAVLAEFDAGEVAVQHELAGASGRSLSACASAPAATWYFPNATTRAGTELLLTLFNPFPTDAVVDVVFEAEDGARTPQDYQGLVVGGGAVATLVVSDVVTLREELATAVTVRAGRVIAEQVQVTTEAEGLPPSLAAMLGAPAPAPVWVFPDGVGADAYEERYALFNPGDEAAEIDLDVLLDDPETNGVADPFEITVQPRRYTLIDVFADGRVPVGVAHAAVVQTRNGVPVVAQRVIVGQAGAAQRGVGSTLGSPVVARRWLAPVGTLAGVSGAALIVFNPSSTESVEFSVRAIGGGRYEVVEGLDGATLPPLGRLIVDIGPGGLGFEGLALEVEAQEPLVAESRLGFATGNDLAYLVAVPVAGSVSAPTGVVGELSDQTVVLGGE